MRKEWGNTTLADIIDIKHGYAFPGEGITDKPAGDILLTPGNFAVGGGFKGDKFKYFCGEIPEDYVLAVGDLLVTMTDFVIPLGFIFFSIKARLAPIKWTLALS